MRDRICSAALELFASKGFHASSMRDLAQAVGVEAASLYYHFPSKQHLLFVLFERTMTDLVVALYTATQAPGTPTERLRNTVRQHVLFHIARRDESNISHSELHALTPENRRLIVSIRDRYETQMRSLLEEGQQAGEFHMDDVSVTAIALLTMCSSVSDWIQPRGRLQADAVADLYAQLALRLVGVQHVAALPKTRAAQRE